MFDTVDSIIKVYPLTNDTNESPDAVVREVSVEESCNVKVKLVRREKFWKRCFCCRLKNNGFLSSDELMLILNTIKNRPEDRISEIVFYQYNGNSQKIIFKWEM